MEAECQPAQQHERCCLWGAEAEGHQKTSAVEEAALQLRCSSQAEVEVQTVVAYPRKAVALRTSFVVPTARQPVSRPWAFSAAAAEAEVQHPLGWSLCFAPELKAVHYAPICLHLRSQAGL